MSATGREFAETAALAAVIEEDEERLVELLGGMTVDELNALAKAASDLMVLASGEAKLRVRRERLTAAVPEGSETR